MFAIDEINKNPQILPNISLGYQIYDSCGAEVRAGSGTLGILSGTQRTVPNYNCWNNGKLLGFLGDFSTSTTYVIAQILNASVRNVSFITNGDTHSLSQYGDPPVSFDIIKWIFLPNKYMLKTKIGNFNASNGTHSYINSSDDLFGPHFRMIPQSLCNEPCAPGYRKSKIEGKPSCCYDCAKCAEGEMSNSTDAFSCSKCPAYQMPDTKRIVCIPKATNYLSFIDTLGASLTAIAFILFITASVVLGIFVKYWDTPIVRANNRYLSCLLLISLMLCFLCTLLFIGRPTQICCLLRQVTFGIVFTISVSSVLAKTLTVIIAFNATKPGSKLKKYVGTQLAIVLVIVCCLGEIIISTVWMVSNPPLVEADIVSKMDTIVLLCNEGSVAFFFCIIGYIGTLALLSFIAAFLAKDFPDRFNEAKNITFSMLGFCSVWGAFVPAYLSSKGSRMVAAEIFAILSSSAGLLGCIFGPKCYIIYLRPELNSRKTTIRKY
ncbi:vomeronasal type-2 receptor 26-like [Xenopus tropicalis]|uniref:Vomeronasal type-2 receptor 26-like n=1 Tax=Xenopus tropicalis TaxID=8364 RepID=A0A8J1JLA1_XENTR|nr:vomeronasal type-2 receptor 26-like [Xenopus tropicalis]